MGSGGAGSDGDTTPPPTGDGAPKEMAEQEVERKKRIHYNNVAFRSGAKAAKREFGAEAAKDDGKYFNHRPHPTLRRLLERMSGEPNESLDAICT